MLKFLKRIVARPSLQTSAFALKSLLDVLTRPRIGGRKGEASVSWVDIEIDLNWKHVTRKDRMKVGVLLGRNVSLLETLSGRPLNESV